MQLVYRPPFLRRLVVQVSSLCDDLLLQRSPEIIFVLLRLIRSVLLFVDVEQSVPLHVETHVVLLDNVLCVSDPFFINFFELTLDPLPILDILSEPRLVVLFCLDSFVIVNSHHLLVLAVDRFF